MENIRPSNLDLESRWYVAPKEAARLTGIGTTKLYEFLASGAIRSIRIGRSRKVSVDSLREWCRAREAQD